MNTKKEKAQQLQNEELKKMLEEQSAALKLMQREATIEVVLEKVRARTMSMQRSDELSDAALILFQQVQSLGMPSWGCGFQIWDDDWKNVTAWMGSDRGLLPPFKIPAHEDVTLHFYEAAQRGESLYIEEMGGEALVAHYKYLSELPVAGDILNSLPAGISVPTFQIMHIANFSQGYLIFITYEPVPEAHDIFKRFAKVFEQTYTRFLDLQKAEAQAREAQIEAALERVRSRTMAMFKSEELNEVVFELFNQMKPLGFAQWGCTIMLADETNEGFNQWLSSPTDRIPTESFHIPKIDHPVFDKLLSVYTNQLPQLTIEIKDTEKYNWDLLWFEKTDLKKTPQSVKESILAATKVVFSTVSLRYGLMIAIDDDPIPDKMIKILSRFAKVFEQTYTRFLDLQKAEAQARELQIQLTMERVRARTMAMQKSEELGEAATLLFKQVQSFGISAFTCGFNIWQADDVSVTSWMSKPDGTFLTPLRLPLTEHPHFIQSYEARKRGEEFFVIEVGGNDLVDTYSYMFGIPEYKKALGDLVDSGFAMPTFQISHYVFFSQGYLLFITYEPVHEMWDIFKRFGKVFEQTYTRFLDLQKAEAQAWEAKIQLSLERIRARAMAMQKTDEMLEAGGLLYKELSNLGIPSMTSGYALMDEEEKIDWQYMVSPEDGTIYPEPLGAPRDGNNILRSMTISWQKQEPFHVIELNPQETIAHQTYIADTTINFHFTAAELISFSPERLVLHTFNFRQGYLLMVSGVRLSAEQIEMMIRFARVFEMTYKRFLDLQKAEAQAREAQIQLALERVRARTMAMQRSDELNQTASLLFQQVKSLGVPPWSCGFNIWEQGDTDFISYMASPEGTILQEYKIPLTEEATFIHFEESRDRGDKLYVDVLEGETIETHYSYFQTLPGIREIFEKRTEAGFPLPTFQINHLANFSHGNLMFITYEPCPEAHDIFIRFAAVFEQTYTRFLDLQKAELQARESQIQLAMERVRARTMAMQRSEELGDVAEILFKQVHELGFQTWSAGFNIWQEGDDSYIDWVTNPSGGFMEPYTVDLTSHPVFREISDAKKRGEDFHVFDTSGESLEETYALLVSFAPKQFGGIKASGISFPARQINHYVYSEKVGLMFITPEPVPEAHDIFKRFGKVFEQTYTRFLDLKNAEEQARESQIQLAMERVRARTMAMLHSDELKDAASLLFKQLEDLGVKSWSSGFNIWQDDGRAASINMCNPDGTIETPYHLPHTEEIFFIKIAEAGQRGDDLLVMETGGKELEETYNYMFSMPEVKKVLGSMEDTGFKIPTFQVNHCAFFSQGYLMFITYEAVPEMWDIFKRFAKVFEQTYTRFLDLQKAEEQAREAKIEAALERVRSRTMAMQRSEELADVATVLFQQVKALGVSQWTCGLNIWEIGDKDYTFYPGSPDGHVLAPFRIPLTEHWVFTNMDESRKRGDEFYMYEKEGERQEEHYRYMHALPGIGNLLQSMLDAGLSFPTFQIDHFANFSHGNLMFITYEHFPEMHDIFKRFAKVFEQTYTRFLDLQKAEAQARESQIQLALERVRARTMAMQKSDELAEVSSLLFQQLKSLGVKSYSSGFTIWDNDHNELVSWMCNADSSMNPPFRMPIAGDAWHSRQYESWKNGEEFILKDIAGEEMQSYFRYLRSFPLLNEAFEKSIAAGHSMPEKQVHNVVNFANGNLLFITLEPCPEAHDIFKRFTKVFEQTYTRFLDLQKAEAQAREAQIEAALERVRSRTIGMQRSDELQGAALLLFQQAEALGVKAFACGFNIWDDNKKFATAWMGSVQGLQNPFKTDSSKDIYLPIYQAAQKGDAFFVREQSGEELKVHYDYLATIPIFRDIFMVNLAKAGFAIPSFQIIHCAFFAQGYLMFISYEPCPEAYDIFKRFAKVFEQTYTRFLDLQKAEAQALEAVKRASVDRVRAEIASMRTTNDLERITPLIWHELTTIGVPFIRCGVFIMDDEMQQVHTFLSTPDGAAIAAFHQPYNAPGETAQIIANWQKKKIYKQHWDEAQFIEFTKNLAEQGAITSGGKYLTENRPTSLDLHFLPFMQGMLYVGNTTPLSDDELQLVQNLADAFSTAYARYEDFNKLESAKEQIEKTLVDLKQAQAQLVQSAKMASLGELTAGIAHEIQNPLNFVNNFSEVNKEMLEELKVERLKPVAERDEQTESEIIEDVIANSEKINHHGKRADAIVKGMLQHSRSSTATKETTNINALADEYLRLAYHGLRAKDKAFNATLKTDFDESIGNINVIPQDIGRVILNLINNAFYAVDEKKKQPQNGYEPTVSVATKKSENKVFISIKDNGNGIPQKIVDKIFQPFFTTKPTGQGTGLGLSLSYDIVKAHGGEIKVESIEGKETTFNILLPNKPQS